MEKKCKICEEPADGEFRYMDEDGALTRTPMCAACAGDFGFEPYGESDSAK